MNLANKLTIFRIVLVPLMVIVALINPQGSLLGVDAVYLIMGAIFIIASITDKLDGYIARSRNQITTFGKFLDPIADKILVLTAMIIFVEFGRLPAWIPVVVLFREFLVSGVRMLASQKQGNVIAASVWGKLKTVTQMIALTLMFIDNYGFFDFLRATTDSAKAFESSFLIYMNMGSYIFNVITSVLMLISVIATIFSGWNYMKNSKDLFKD